MPANHQQKHQAGRHLAVGQALLRGASAQLVGPTTYVQINGTQAQVQVAAQGAWQIADVEKYVEGTIEAVILVDITGAVPEFYILPGDEVRALVRVQHAEFMARVGGSRPRNPDSKHAKIDTAEVQRWKGNWALFD